MLTALEDIRNKARKAHAEQQYLIAEQHYRTLLRKEANLDDAINLGALLRSQGRLQEASDFYTKWINFFGAEERLLLNACNCWNDNNEAARALQYLEPLIRKAKISPKLRLCACDSLHRLNRLKDCITLLKDCLKGKANDKEIWIRLGLALAKSQDLSGALDAFTRANQIDPKDLMMVANRITIYKDLGQFDKAESLIADLSEKQQLQVDIELKRM